MSGLQRTASPPPSPPPVLISRVFPAPCRWTGAHPVSRPPSPPSSPVTLPSAPPTCPDPATRAQGTATKQLRTAAVQTPRTFSGAEPGGTSQPGPCGTAGPRAEAGSIHGDVRPAQGGRGGDAPGRLSSCPTTCCPRGRNLGLLCPLHVPLPSLVSAHSELRKEGPAGHGGAECPALAHGPRALPGLAPPFCRRGARGRGVGDLKGQGEGGRGAGAAAAPPALTCPSCFSCRQWPSLLCPCPGRSAS